MEQVFIESFILGLFVGIVLSILILDDYCETKMNEFYQEREAQYYISKAEKIKNKEERENEKCLKNIHL